MERRFVVDSMLGKLAKWLRILGFDARFERIALQEQIDGWKREGFLILTRNRRWKDQSQVLHLAADDPMKQLEELIAGGVVSRDEIKPLARCIVCNMPLEVVPREEALGEVPDYVYETHSRFHRCAGCRRIYWRGSHPRRIVNRLKLRTGWSI
jgi:hypothetical protein